MNIELNNVRNSELDIKNEAQMKKISEICSSIFNGTDDGKFGKEKDSIAAHLKKLSADASNGDNRARAEINTIVKYIVQPKLLQAMDVLGYLGNYKKIGKNETPEIVTYTYENLNARIQATGGDVSFTDRKQLKYTIPMQTISAGMAVNYVAMERGDFAGSIGEEINQVLVDMQNKAVAYALNVLNEGIKNTTNNVKFYGTYDTAPTQSAVDEMIAKMRKIGRVNILSDFANLAIISDWNGYKTIGSNNTPFFTQEQVIKYNMTGLDGFYKGAALVELVNPYNYTKPLTTGDGFETYLDTDKLYFTVGGTSSPLNIISRGGISTMSGNDVKTGTVMTRFDMEIGADLTKGREYEIGLLEKAD